MVQGYSAVDRRNKGTITLP